MVHTIGTSKMMFRIAAVLLGMGALAGCSSSHRGYVTLPGGGMEPCFLRGSRSPATFAPYESPSDVRRGDIILFRGNIQGRSSEVAWRVVGLPSDHIELDETTVLVNRQPLSKRMKQQTSEWILYAESSDDISYCVLYRTRKRPDQLAHFEMTVPPDHFLVLGDNRDLSYDGRFIGAVAFDSILARFDTPACSCPGAP